MIPRRQEPGKVTVGIVEVAKVDALRRAHLLTGCRWDPVLDSVNAERALVYGTDMGIYEPGAIRAGCNTCLAARTLVLIDLNGSTRPVV